MYCALIGYIHYEAPLEEQNFATLIEFLNAMEVKPRITENGIDYIMMKHFRTQWIKCLKL